MSQWEGYYSFAGEKPNGIVGNVLKRCVRGRAAALDLGAGNLRDSKFLLSQGFERVVAVDESEDSKKFLVPGIELHISRIETYIIEPNTFDYVISCNTLFFLTHQQIKELFGKVLKSLRSKGVLTCNVLGMEHEWVQSGEAVSFFTETELKNLCSGFKILGIGELKNSDTSVKRHLLGIVVSKP